MGDAFDIIRPFLAVGFVIAGLFNLIAFFAASAILELNIALFRGGLSLLFFFIAFLLLRYRSSEKIKISDKAPCPYCGHNIQKNSTSCPKCGKQFSMNSKIE